MKFPWNEQGSVGAVRWSPSVGRSWEEICKIFIIPEITPSASQKKLERLERARHPSDAILWAARCGGGCTQLGPVLLHPASCWGVGCVHSVHVRQGFFPLLLLSLLLIVLLAMQTATVLQRLCINPAVN